MHTPLPPDRDEAAHNTGAQSVRNAVTENISQPETDQSTSTADPKPTPAVSTDPKPESFGRIDDSQTVWVKDGETEREVGSYPEGAPEDPFHLYVRRYLELKATIDLFEARLPSLPSKDIDVTLSTLNEALVQPMVVGDIPALRSRVLELASRAESRKNQLREERRAAREEALAVRTKVVESAEAIAEQPADKIQWKQSGAELRDLLDQWKSMQRGGPRLDKAAEDELWKRFSAARTTFDRGRRQYFSALDQRQKEVKETKERLIAEAVALQNSSDWRETSSAYRDLMEQWKGAGRASRKEDDELWSRFRAAQQVFFDSRREHDRVTNETFGENLAKKEELAAEAEALLPIKNLDKARKSLRDIQDRWEEVGRVSSRDSGRIEGRLKAVEREVREAESREWRRTDPETKARAEGMLGQLEQSIEDLKSDLAAAEAAGDTRRAKEIGDALATKQMWYDQISSSVD